MRGDSGRTIRYKWSIKTVEGEQSALYSGHESKEALSSLFAMWLQNRGDVSNWHNASLFGKIVHTYSTLSVPVIAVWLGIQPAEIYEVDVPGTPPWEFHGPTGNLLRVTQTRTQVEVSN